MSPPEPSLITLALAAADFERPAVLEGVRQAATCLERAGSSTLELRVASYPDQDALMAAPLPCVAFLSLGAALDRSDDTQVEALLTAPLEQLPGRGVAVLLLNQFRYVADRREPAQASRLLRIRRFNRMAIGLAQRFDITLVDVDRILADLGALNLLCDYRLGSPRGQVAAGYAVARALLANGLLDRVDQVLLDRALAQLVDLDGLKRRVMKLSPTPPAREPTRG